MAYFIILRTLNLEPGDEIILSPLACLEATQPLVAYGLKIKWVDVSPKTGTISPENLKLK